MCATTSGFTWVPGNQTHVLMLTRQALGERLPSLRFRFYLSLKKYVYNLYAKKDYSPDYGPDILWDAEVLQFSKGGILQILHT